MANGWDPDRVRAAYADARKLVEAFGADGSGDAYRRALDDVVAPLDDVTTKEKLGELLAYMIYGQTVLGLGALTVAEQVRTLSREQVFRSIETGLDELLG